MDFCFSSFVYLQMYIYICILHINIPFWICYCLLSDAITHLLVQIRKNKQSTGLPTLNRKVKGSQ